MWACSTTLHLRVKTKQVTQSTGLKGTDILGDSDVNGCVFPSGTEEMKVGGETILG